MKSASTVELEIWAKMMDHSYLQCCKFEGVTVGANISGSSGQGNMMGINIDYVHTKSMS